MDSGIKPADITKFQQAVVQWYHQQGRKGLPWQNPRDPYRVWISEIMLQQTQVATVIPYFNEFIHRFPTLVDLAHASEDNVLHLWTGLGYYSRARNLLKCAQILVTEHQAKFPQRVETLIQLPGIGPSTAGAILALGLNIPAPILDGNVKRVLCRYHAIADWPGKSVIHKQLWTLSEQYTPKNNQIIPYTQGMMDLGALICTRTQPKCLICPLQTTCQGYAQGNPDIYPSPKPYKPLPNRTTYLLMLRNPQGEILLEKRPPVGIWGGLWSFPLWEEEDWQSWCEKTYHCVIKQHQSWPTFKHTFTHYHLHITPIAAQVIPKDDRIQATPLQTWCPLTLEQPLNKGMPMPIKKCWQQLATCSTL